tara:strand:+ start:614 stop:838 length:225 start_codon:yes stop_codon:yes gene_type:complete
MSCQLRDTVFSYLENHTKDEIEEMLETTEVLLIVLKASAKAGDEKAITEYNKFAFARQALSMAIAFLERTGEEQ